MISISQTLDGILEQLGAWNNVTLNDRCDNFLISFMIYIPHTLPIKYHMEHIVLSYKYISHWI